MKMEIDHYAVLGLPSGEEGAKLTDADINKAYKIKALELHPDKRPDDPNANINFLNLSESYEFLKRQRQSSQDDPRKRKRRDDLHEPELSSFAEEKIRSGILKAVDHDKVFKELLVGCFGECNTAKEGLKEFLEDVTVRQSKKKKKKLSALASTCDAAKVVAMKGIPGDLSNLLFVGCL
ncbi:hypothetical protein MKW94_004417 [Papaver nudicaule]|uniref:J domain-containing protein n=1 Tax=Papaver nudicaule TaxID=74823 RepID=A0AA41UWY1_PAPNU|nr:hypothetical protein [Papaver nudicaule]